MKKEFRSFKDARKIARSLHLNTIDDWRIFCKSQDFPNDVPKAPQVVYKKEWSGVGDWLGTERIATMKKEFLSFLEARQFVHSLNIKSNSEWRNYCKSGKKPNDIPSTPARTYKNKGWINEGDWLGTGTIASYNVQFRSFFEAKKFVQTLKLQNEKEWREYTKSGNKPEDIPSTPARHYKKEWKGFGDWLGTERIANQDKKYLPWKEAKPLYQKFAQKYGLKNNDDWEKFQKTHKKLLEKFNLPPKPRRVYSKDRIQKRLREK